MEFHLWQAYNPNKISVDISLILKNKIKSFVIGKINKISKEIKINPSRLYEYFIYQNKPIPLDKLILISKLMNISLIKMEKEIIMYKNMYVPIKNSVKEPKLPIKISPYFTSIVAHLFFDGSVPEDGKGTYYSQKKESIMQIFIQKIEEVFGKVQYSLVTDHRGVLKLRTPRIIGEICKHIYKVKTFNGNTAVLPKFIFSLNKEHKRAFILAAILDEGSIGYDGTISFGVSNKILCENVRDLCNSIELKTSHITCRIKENNHYYFRILSKKEFLCLIKEFSKKYPLNSLDYKKKICSKCIGTEQQKKRKCFALTGWNNKILSCMQMEKYTQAHTKEHRLKEIKILMEDLTNDIKAKNKGSDYYE
jgi:hypothetical protein